MVRPKANPGGGSRDGRVVLLAALITIATSTPLFILGALGPHFESDGITPTQLGLAVAAYTGAQAIAAAALSRVTDRAKVSSMLRWSLVITATSLLAMGTVQFGWYLLVAAAALGGVGAATAQPAASDFVVRNVTPGTYGRAFGILQASKPVTVLLLGLAVGLLAWASVGAFVLLAVVAVLCLMVLLFISDSGSRVERSGASIAVRLARRPVILLAVCAGLSLGAGTTMVSFLPLSAADAGMSASEISILLTVGSATAIVMRISIGIFADRFRVHPLAFAAILTGLGAAGFALLAGDDRTLEFAGGLLAFAGAWGSTGLLYLAGAASGIGTPARVTGLMVTGGGVGSTVLPILFGMTASTAGYSVAWLGLAVVAGLAAVAALLAVAARPPPTVEVGSHA